MIKDVLPEFETAPSSEIREKGKEILGHFEVVYDRVYGTDSESY